MFGFSIFYAPFLRSSVSYINKNSVKIVPFHLAQFLIQLYVHLFVSCNVKFGTITIIVTGLDLLYTFVSSGAWQFIYRHHTTKESGIDVS